MKQTTFASLACAHESRRFGLQIRGSLTLLLLPAMAHSEVMDKEPSLLVLLSMTTVGAIGAFLAARYRPWIVGVVLLVVGVFFAGQYSELLDPSVGPAIRREAGELYVLVSWSGLFFVIPGAVAGLLVRRRHQAVTKTH